MKNSFLYLCLGIITFCSCRETSTEEEVEAPIAAKRINNNEAFETRVLAGEKGQQFIFNQLEITDQNAGAVAGIRINLDFDFIHNDLTEKKLKRLLKFYVTISTTQKEVYNSEISPPTEKQDYYYNDEQSELIKPYRSPEKGLRDTIHFQQSIFIPYFRINAPAGKLAANITLNLKNTKQAAKWGDLVTVAATFDKPKRKEATFTITELKLDPTKKYDAAFGLPAKKKPDIQWFIRNDGYVFYSSEVQKDNYSLTKEQISFAFSEGDNLQFEVIDFDKGIGNANDRIATIDLPYTEGDLDVKKITKGDIVSLSYLLKVTQ